MDNIAGAGTTDGGSIKPRRMLAIAIVLAIGIACAVVLYLFNPAENGFYPRCLLYRMTGLQCPGCGSLRALHQLTHGHIATAFRFNPLLVILMPLALWYCVREIIWQITGQKLPGVTMKAGWGWILLVVIVTFGIVRNLPIFGGS